MKLIIKSLYQKHLFQYGILVILFTLTILSIQTSATITIKNKTLINQMNEINAAHTTIYSQGTDPDGDYYLEEYLNTFNDINKMNLIDYFEENYYIGVVNNETESDSFASQYCIIEGFLNQKHDNNYHVLKGKPLADLNGNEIAINEKYARTINVDLNKVIGKKLKRTSVTSGKVPNTMYEIVSIFEDPKTGVLSNSENNISELFEAQNTHMAETPYWGFMDYESIKAQAVETFTFTTKTVDGNNVIEETKEKLLYTNSYRLHYKNYTMENEATLFTLSTYNVEPSETLISFQPFYTLLIKQSMAENIFKFLTYTLLSVLIIADFFIFYSFFKRQLEEDKEKLALMSISGVKQKQIIYAYLFGILTLMSLAIILVIVFDVGAYILGIQRMKYLSIFYQITPSIILITLVGTFAFILILFGLTVLSLRNFSKKDLIETLKEKDLALPKHIYLKIGYHNLLSSFTWRDMISNKWKLLRTTIASTILILSLLLTYSAYHSLTNLYNSKTLGIHFDYVISGINEKQYNVLKQKYVKDLSIMSVENKYYNEKVSEIDDISIFLSYPAKLIRIYDDMRPFVDLYEGSYPEEAEYFVPEKGVIYEDKQVLISRKIVNLKDATFADGNNKVTSLNKGMLSYSDVPYGYFRESGKYTYIKGSTDSLLNNGYSSFTIFRDDIGIKKHAISRDNNFDFNHGETIINIKKGIDKKEFENWMKNENIQYTAYSTIIAEFNKTNIKVQQQTFIIMIFVSSIMLLLLALITFANATEDHMQKRNQYKFMSAIGFPQRFIHNWNIAKVFGILSLSAICAIVMYIPIKQLYFSILSRVIGVYAINSNSFAMLINIVILLLIFLSWIKYKDKKR